MRTVQRVARGLRAVLQPDGINIIQNNGAAAGQTVFPTMSTSFRAGKATTRCGYGSHTLPSRPSCARWLNRSARQWQIYNKHMGPAFTTY